MRTGLVCMVVLALSGGLAWADAAQDVNVPYLAPDAAVTVDGDLSEWADAAWVALDTAYAGTAADITSGKYAVRWSDAANLLYVACEVVDVQQHRADGYLAWNGQDDIEVYVDAANNDMAYSSALDDYAQQIVFGVGPTDVAWSDSSDANLVPAFAVVGLGDAYVYEMAIAPYGYYAGNGGTALPQATVDLAMGQNIGLDVVAGTLMDDGTFAMLANNAVGAKFRLSDAMQTWTLVPEPASLSLLALGGIALLRRRR
ncbi:MAG: PEP-CTERM sorting domain-containing protein [Planctomycetes bacterium]|jgi:hypothetical protein|nr:PEP-CTERM sorting domain-containing protein [Planctomycetota bacterium]